MKYLLGLFCAILLSSCTIKTVNEDYLRKFLGMEKREVEMEFGEPDFCKPDKYGEVCEFSEYRPRWKDTLHLRFYFDSEGRCTQISTY